MQETIGNFKITPSDVAGTFYDVQRKDVWNRLWAILERYDNGATEFSQYGLTTKDPNYNLAYREFRYWAELGGRPHAVKAVHELHRRGIFPSTDGSQISCLQDLRASSLQSFRPDNALFEPYALLSYLEFLNGSLASNSADFSTVNGKLRHERYNDEPVRSFVEALLKGSNLDGYISRFLSLAGRPAGDKTNGDALMPRTVEASLQSLSGDCSQAETLQARTLLRLFSLALIDRASAVGSKHRVRFDALRSVDLAVTRADLGIRALKEAGIQGEIRRLGPYSDPATTRSSYCLADLHGANVFTVGCLRKEFEGRVRALTDVCISTNTSA